MPVTEIMTSQELDQHSKIPRTKAKDYILLKKGQRQRQKAWPFLHKGIINNKLLSIEVSYQWRIVLPMKDSITIHETDQYSKIPMTKSKGKNEKKFTMFKQDQTSLPYFK